MTVRGVLWHSTGANNEYIKRYVQPYDDSELKEHDDNTYTNKEWLTILGKNPYNNDWNHVSRSAGLNCWIGKFADESVGTVQTMPWDFKPWGCGSGPNGSCNNGWIQFEICEDSLTDKKYFEAIYTEACELTAYLCWLYHINPQGTVIYNGVTVPTILCHADSHALGLGSNHGDVLHWFKKYGKTMEDVKKDVTQILRSYRPTYKPVPPPSFPSGSPPSTTPEYPQVSRPGIPPVNAVTAVIVDRIETTAIDAKITFNTDDTFNKYTWSYTLTNIKTNTTSNESFEVKSTSFEVKLPDLTPNNTYFLELLAKDEFGNEIKVPGVLFSTAQDYPGVAESVAFNLQEAKVSFLPNTWGKYTNRSNGYRISVVVNGIEVAYKDIFSNDAALVQLHDKMTYNAASLIKLVSLNSGDCVQLGVQPWVKDEYNNKIAAEPGPRYSKSTRIEPELTPIDKLFLNTRGVHQRVMLYYKN